MGLILDNDKFLQYRYKLEEFKILIGGEAKVIEPFQVVNISIDNDYEENVLPIFKVSITIDPPTYYSIIKNKDTVKFKVRLQKYSKEILSNKISLVTDVINDTFSVFLGDEDAQFDEAGYNQRREAEGLKKGELSMHELNHTLDLFLFKDVYVSNIRNNVNIIAQSVNLTTLVSWLLTQGKCNGALMSPLENKKVYSPVIIPPLSVIDAIRHLDSEYGFYRKGAIIYFALDRPYILNYKGGCTAWVRNEWKDTSILVLNKENKDSRIASTIMRQGEKIHYINVMADDIQIANDTITSNVTGGSNAMVIDAHNDSINNNNSGATVKGQSQTKMLFNDSNNEFLGTTFAAQQKANSCIINASISEFNLEAISPNKSISFIFEKSELTQQYRGLYRIASSLIKFSKDGDDFSMTASCTFKKVD